MKRFYIALFFIGLMASGSVSFGQTSPCSISHSGGNCLGQPITFYKNCPDNYDNHSWVIDGTPIGSGPSQTYTFNTTGSHTIKLGSWCSTCQNTKPVYTQTTIFIEAVPRPSITASTTQLCESGNVTLSVDPSYTNSGYDFLWRSVPAGFTGSGTSVTFNNVSITTTFYLTISGEACTNENQITVNVSKTSLSPALGAASFYHRQTLTTGNGVRAGHYWEQSSTGTDVNNPVNGNYLVYESGDYYTRYYSAATNCWANPLGPVHVTINYAPPLASAGQILKPGYNEVYFANDEKDYIFSYADYYWVNNTSDNPSIVRPYCVNGVVTGSKLYKNGTYYLKGRDRGTNTWGPTQTITVSLRGDESLNWVHTQAFDGTTETINGQATDKVVSESKSYFGDDGKNLQSQTKSFTTGKIMTSQELRDQYDRTVGSTLPAPIASADFSYNAAFVLAPSGDVYDHNDFDNTSPGSVNTVYNPVEVNDTEEGTVGWYYSANNTLETNVPKTKYPYSRVDFYNDGTGEARRSSGVGEVLRFGTGHESLSGTFPVYQELQDYLSKRTIVLPGITQDGVLFNEGVQMVARDQNGKYTVSITDKAGHVVMAARAGKDTDKVLSISNTITSSGSPASANYRAMTYFYILQAQAVSVTGSSDFIVEDIVSEVRKDPGQTFAGSDGKWPAGFYRILLTSQSSEITLSYKNYFLDVSYSFYNDMGRLVSSVSPNGMKEWLSVTTNLDTKYATIDKTTYQYNFRGWLMSVTEPDAGTTNYKYRSDGKIRFSQNAQQSIDKHFSYTHYDKLGRPVESGEYTGTQYTFASLNNQLEYNQQVSFSSSDTRDWVVTHYDFADADFNGATGLGSKYAQDYVDGTVSWSENTNIKTWYSYDELGRVTWMAQRPATLDRVFVVKYTYDFLGNVLTAANLAFKAGDDYIDAVLLEQFYHYYEYDADRRLSKAYTSVTATGEKKLRATYSYYLHGPLKRIELGDKLQGIDFVYNINGWLTQINHPDKSKDPGSDDNDAFGMLLNYYESDLTSVFQTGSNSPELIHDPNSFHKLPGNSEKQSIAFEPKAAYRQNMLETLAQLKALREKESNAIEEKTLVSENDPAMDILPVITSDAFMPMHEPDFAVMDTWAVASAKTVLYEQPMATNVVPDDVEFAALKAIFDNLGGTGWTKKTNWPTVGNWPATATSAQFATWFGVTVSNGDVVSINLPSNNMIGTIPAAIANLTELTSIYLQGNKISGSIPTQIGSLSKLTLLYLYANSLSGTIPPSLGNLKQLVYLALFRNTLTGSIPVELGSLTSLQTLRLDENSLSGTIPAALGNLTNLNYLNFYKNALTGPIPAEFNSLTNLGTLNLSYNKLSGAIPNLSNLTNLTTFDIRSNPFSGSVPAWLGSIATLQYVYLGLNGLSGTIPASLGSLQNLKVLAINANALTGTLPPELGELTNLEELYFYQNQLTGELPPSYGLLTKLKIFNVSQNKFTGNIPESYRNLTELTYFDVQTNQLSGELPDIFGGWTKVTSFYVTANQFTGAIPASVGNMINLTVCYLSNNAFTSAPASLLNLTKAQALVLDGNKLHSIPDFTTMPNKAVLYLYVRNNYLNAADLEPLYTAANASPFRTLYATPQLVDPGARISVPQGQSLTIMAEGKTANTTFVWEKQSGTTWTDVTSKSQSTNPDVFLINSPVASDAGIYRYRVTTSKITALSITSSPITVQTVDALPIPVATNNTLYNGLITSVQWRTDQAFSSTEGDY
ncbi:MAG TPA: hypothetical protein VIM75_18875, partial [Ohtaekwangia sp.]|uniref:leucine-rich repeat domain-containing protein n=1 Tax=Ohtaekwangia sp. TaxID=2066019 RepID=UPI002F92D90A